MRIKLFANYELAGQTLSQLREALSGLDSNLGNAGQLLTGLGSGVGNLARQLEKLKEANKTRKEGGSLGFETYTSAAQSAIQLVTLAINASRERKKAEQEYYNSVISQQKQSINF